MADNRMYLVSTETGDRVMLAKYFPSEGWYVKDAAFLISELARMFGHDHENGDGFNLSCGRTSYVIEYEEVPDPLEMARRRAEYYKSEAIRLKAVIEGAKGFKSEVHINQSEKVIASHERAIKERSPEDRITYILDNEVRVVWDADGWYAVHHARTGNRLGKGRTRNEAIDDAIEKWGG